MVNLRLRVGWGLLLVVLGAMVGYGAADGAQDDGRGLLQVPGRYLGAVDTWSANGGPTFEDQLMMAVNQARWDNGQLAPLKRQSQLDNSSETHSGNMAARNFFSHCDLDTMTTPGDRMIAAGYNWNSAAENIAAGYPSPAAVMQGWMASSGHRANILSTSYRELGLGYYYQGGDQGNVRVDNNSDCNVDLTNQGPYYHYWTQDFGRINTVYPVVINREAYETNSSNVSLYMYGQGWAQDMRFSNDNVNWSGWEPFGPNKSWTLTAGSGMKTVYAQIRNGGTTRNAQDMILLNEPTMLPPQGYLPAVLGS